MTILLRLLVLTFALNIVRYFVGGPIEGVILMEPMHKAMSVYPDVWDNDFTQIRFCNITQL